MKLFQLVSGSLYEYISEQVRASHMPVELKNKSILYHSTDYESFFNILKSNKIFGTTGYGFGISTSRDRYYRFGRDEEDEEDEDGYYYHNQGQVQIILDRSKIKSRYKVKPVDWEEGKSSLSNVGERNDFHQSEDKILTCKIENIFNYIVGMQFLKDDYKQHINNDFIQLVNNNNWQLYDKDWNKISN